MTPLETATWLLSGRLTAAAPGATDFLGGALAEAERGAPASAGPGILAVAFGIFWKLLLVTLLIVLAVWVLRRFMKPGGLALAPQGAIRIIAVNHLDARRSIYLVDVGERLLVVGAGADSLNLLTEITSPVEKGQIRERIRETESGTFSSYLSAWAGKMAGFGGTRQTLEEGKSFLEQKLKDFRKGKERKEGKPE